MPHVSCEAKKVSINKNETESEMENFTHAFRETNLVLQRKYSELKLDTDKFELTEEMRVHFCNVFLALKYILKIYQRALLHKLLRLSLKSSKVFSVYS